MHLIRESRMDIWVDWKHRCREKGDQSRGPDSGPFSFIPERCCPALRNRGAHAAGWWARGGDNEPEWVTAMRHARRHRASVSAHALAQSGCTCSKDHALTVLNTFDCDGYAVHGSKVKNYNGMLMVRQAARCMQSGEGCLAACYTPVCLVAFVFLRGSAAPWAQRHS